MIWLRRLHLYIGFTLVPLVIVQALTGFLLRLRVTSELTHVLHTWFKYRFDFGALSRVIGVFLSVLLAVGLLYLGISGAALYANMRIQQLRRAVRHRHPAGPD